MLRRFRFLPCVLLLAPGCIAESTLAPETEPPSLLIGPGGCAFQYLTSGILEPINADGSSSIQLGRTLPVKVRITDCVSGDGVNTLAPQVSRALVDLGGGPVNELESSSAADEGTSMRSAGNGQYIFNLSTKRSQFNAGEDLRAGVYQLTIRRRASSRTSWCSSPSVRNTVAWDRSARPPQGGLCVRRTQGWVSRAGA